MQELTKEQYAKSQAVIEAATRYGITCSIGVIDQLAGILQYAPTTGALTDVCPLCNGAGDQYEAGSPRCLHCQGSGKVSTYSVPRRTAEPQPAVDLHCPNCALGDAPEETHLLNTVEHPDELAAEPQCNCLESSQPCKKHGKEPIPSPVDAPSGDVMRELRREAQIAALYVVRRDMLENPPAQWINAVDKAILDNYTAHGMMKNEQFRKEVRARLQPSEKTPEELVTVHESCVFVDGAQKVAFTGLDSESRAERYAAELRAELESKHGLKEGTCK